MATVLSLLMVAKDLFAPATAAEAMSRVRLLELDCEAMDVQYD
jgi:hypothetical protein